MIVPFDKIYIFDILYTVYTKYSVRNIKVLIRYLVNSLFCTTQFKENLKGAASKYIRMKKYLISGAIIQGSQVRNKKGFCIIFSLKTDTNIKYPHEIERILEWRFDFQQHILGMSLSNLIINFMNHIITKIAVRYLNYMSYET